MFVTETVHNFIGSAALLLMLLNPFLLIVYLIDLVQDMDFTAFSKVLSRAGVISVLVFIFFAP